MYFFCVLHAVLGDCSRPSQKTIVHQESGDPQNNQPEQAQVCVLSNRHRQDRSKIKAGKTNSTPEIRLGTGTQHIARERAEGPELSLKGV